MGAPSVSTPCGRAIQMTLQPEVAPAERNFRDFGDRKIASIVVLLALSAAACSEPLEFADWTIPVPEGTRIIEYAAVPIEERTDRIELIRSVRNDLGVGLGEWGP